MPRAKLDVGYEFSQFPSSNLTITHDGEVTLALVNLAPNPDFTQFHPHKHLKHHRHKHHHNSHGWHAHVKQKADDRITKQSRSHHKHHHSHQHVGNLDVGSTPPDPSEVGLLPAPDAPIVDVVANSATGYVAATYGTAMFWIMADPTSGGGDDAANSQLRTQAGPRTNVTTTSTLRHIQFTLPAVLPRGATGVGIAMTAPGDSNGTLYVQSVELVETGVGETVTLGGDFKFTEVTVSANTTYLGDLRVGAAPIYWYAPAEFDLQAIRVRLSYRLLTQAGWSASQGITAWIDTPAIPRGALWWMPPEFPEGTIDWEAEFQLNDEDGPWHTLSPRRYYIITPDDELTADTSSEDSNNLVKHYAALYQAEIEEYPTELGRPVQNDPSQIDYSGIPAPDVSFPAVTAVAATGLADVTTGSIDHEVRVTHVVENAQGPQSPPTTVTVPANSTVRILPPALSNQLPNGDLFEADSTTGLEIDWQTPTLPGGVTPSFSQGLMQLIDASGATTTTEVKRSRPIPVDPTQTSNARIAISMPSYTSGTLKLIYREMTAGFATTHETVVATLSGVIPTATPNIYEIKLGPAGTYSDIILNPSTVLSQWVVQHVGVGGNTRNFTSQISHAYHGKGHGAPRKRRLGRPRHPHGKPGQHHHGPVNHSETRDIPYPEGNYAVVVDTPPDGALRSADIVLTHESLEYQRFTSPLWTFAQSAPTDGVTTSEITAAARIDGTYGWHIQATSTTTNNSVSAVYPVATNLSDGGYTGLFYVPTLPSSGTVRLCQLETASGTRVGSISLSSAGVLTLTSQSSVGTLQTATLGYTVVAGDVIRLRIMGIFSSTTAGQVTASVTANGKTAPISTVSLSNIDWSTSHISQVRVGAFSPTLTGITFNLNIDSLTPISSGEGTATAIPGHAAEYFGVHGIPHSYDNFLTGLKIPITPGASYCESIFLETAGIDGGASPLGSEFCDAKGHVLQTNQPIVSAITGTNEWQRYYQVVTAPLGAKYLKYHRSNVGGGRLRAMGLQFEHGNFPTPFTNGYALSGTITPIWNLSVPLPDGANVNQSAIPFPSKVKQFLRAGAMVTKDPSPGSTNYTIRYSSSDDGGFTWSAWQTDLTLVPAGTYFRMEVTLLSTDGTKTPVMRSSYLDFVRASAVLTRLDGSEYVGGCFVSDMAPVQQKYNIQSKTFADESQGFTTFGLQPKKEIAQAVLQCFLEETTLEITKAQGRGDASFVIEDPQLLQRYIVRFFDCDFGKKKIDRTLYYPIAGTSEYAWIHESDITALQVLGQADL